MNYKNIIEKMTLKEKTALLSGKGEWSTREIKRLGIPSLFFSDGTSGIRKQTGTGDHLGLNPSSPATCFPSASTTANSWDEELEEELGEGLGMEALEEGVHVLLGPGLNIKRNPLCGRNFEYFSEDPYLSGKMAAACIRGIQKKGVGACAKHFAVNSQETRRMAMNSVLDERTLREIYLTGFEIAVKEGKAKAVMSSYNEVNGIYANENRHLLIDILRKEWGFQGFVVTDWGGSNDHAAGVKNGSTLEMPTAGYDSAQELIEALHSGKISEADIDQRVDELLTAVFELNQSDRVHSCEETLKESQTELHQRNHQLARKVLENSAVLLKNDGNLLPLKRSMMIAVIGEFAFSPRYQGSGSSAVNSVQVDTIIGCMKQYDLQIAGTVRGYRIDGQVDAALTEEAVEAAIKADVVLYFFGLPDQYESEGLDRKHLRIPKNQILLLQELAQANPNIIGIISAGSAIEMPWHYYCKAILHAGLMGEAGAEGVWNILTGKCNPSGKLTETIINRYEDTPSYQYYPAKERNSEYRESIYVGYRYFDTAGVKVLYPFGYGLSYTSFSYRDLKTDPKGVSFVIKNIGERDGAEICQMYIGFQDARVFRPKKELKGFKKVFLKKGEETEVKIPFDEYTFRYWNVHTNSWEIEKGTYQIMIGTSSRDICLKGEIQVAGSGADCPYNPGKLPSYYSGKIQDVSQEEFQELYGRELSDGSWKGEIGMNDALCQMYYAKSRIARLICRIYEKKIQKAENEGRLPDLNLLFQYNMPFRAIAKMTGGAVSMGMVRGLIKMVNGHLMKGMLQILRESIKKGKIRREFEKEWKEAETE